MDSSSLPTARRNEDIALDLMKFVASHSHVSKPTGATPGFSGGSSAKSDDQVTQLLELYTRCREAVESPVAGTAKK